MSLQLGRWGSYFPGGLLIPSCLDEGEDEPSLRVAEVIQSDDAGRLAPALASTELASLGSWHRRCGRQ